MIQVILISKWLQKENILKFFKKKIILELKTPSQGHMFWRPK